MPDEVDGDDLGLEAVRPLVEDDPALAARLTKPFSAALESADLSPSERDYLRGYAQVRIASGQTRGGVRVLRLEFGGSTTTIEWDGSEGDAEEIVDGVAENAAHNAAGDLLGRRRWVAGVGHEARRTVSQLALRPRALFAARVVRSL